MYRQKEAENVYWYIRSLERSLSKIAKLINSCQQGTIKKCAGSTGRKRELFGLEMPLHRGDISK